MSIQPLLSMAILLFILGFAFQFHSIQNRKSASDVRWIGGEISWPKAFWLAYAIGSWFLVPFVFLSHPGLPGPLRAVLVLHLASWWIRGMLELVMIYRWFNWTPIYGITHDVLHNTLIMALAFWAFARVGWEGLIRTPIAAWCGIYLAVLCFAMMSEAVFAALFLLTRKKGDEKIYFASGSPEYRTINRMTLAVCVVVYLHIFVQSVGMILWH